MGDKDTKSKRKEQDEKELRNSFVEQFLPSIIEVFLNQNQDLADKDIGYILSEIRKEDVFRSIVSSIQVSFSIYDEFIRATRDAIEKKMYHVAVILSNTAIEHILNMFYTALFIRKYDLSQSYIDSALNDLNMKDKCTWFIRIIADEVFEERLINDILGLNALRNPIIHYRAYGQPLDNIFDDDTLAKKIKSNKAIIEKAPTIILNLKNSCDQIINRIAPNKQKANEIVNILKAQIK